VGRPPVLQGFRCRPADRLHLDRRRPALDLRARQPGAQLAVPAAL